MEHTLCKKKIVQSIQMSKNLGQQLAQKMIDNGGLELLKYAEKIAF